MKLNTAELHGLLSTTIAAESPSPPKPRTTSRQCGRETARLNEFKTMKAVAQYGHLRIAEIAMGVWPHARFGAQVARRTVARLTKGGLLLERRNALGSRSLCLTRVGASWLNARGIEAQHGTDLSSVAGATFFHRTLGNSFLLQRQIEGFQVASEYQILRRQTPFLMDGLVKALRKLPDGAVWKRGSVGGGPIGTQGVELVEVEVSCKARPELERCLRSVEFVGMPLDAAGMYRLSGLTFVFDRELNHAKRVMLAANSLWGARPRAEREILERRVKLVAVELRDPLVWVSSSVTSLHDLRQRRI